MRRDDNRNFVAHLSWDKVASRISSGASAILPIGAGAKEHGFHLPMNTDFIQAEIFAALLADRIDAIIWPTVSYGYYPAFSAYAGSCSISQNTFRSLISDIVSVLLAHGCKTVLILDAGISTIAPIDDLLCSFGSSKILNLSIHNGKRYKSVATRIAQQAHGSHADELETSLMLELAPQLVDMARAEASPNILRAEAGPLTPSDLLSPNYSYSGCFGNPTLATLTKGRVLVDAIIDDLLDQAVNFISGASAQDAQGHNVVT